MFFFFFFCFGGVERRREAEERKRKKTHKKLTFFSPLFPPSPTHTPHSPTTSPPTPHPPTHTPPIPRPTLQDVHHQARRRPLRVHQQDRVRVRPFRRGPLLDVGLGGPGDGRRPRLQGAQEQLHRRDRRRSDHGRDGLRGDEPRRLPRHQHDRDPERQPAGVAPDPVQRQEPGPRGRAVFGAGEAAGQQAAARAPRDRQGRVEAASGAAAGGDCQDRRVRARHDLGFRVDFVRGAGPLLHRAARRAQPGRPDRGAAGREVGRDGRACAGERKFEF